MKNKALILALLISAIVTGTFAQTGPGGVGNTNNNLLWLAADKVEGANNGQVMSIWMDASGNIRNAFQATAANKPTFQTGVINGKPVLRFDGTNHYMNTGVYNWGSELTAMTVVIPGNWTTNYARILETRFNQHFYLGRSNSAVYKLIVCNNSFPYGTCNGGTIANGVADIVGATYSHDGTSGPGNLYENGSLVATNTFNKPTVEDHSMFIAVDYTLGANKYRGDIAEIIYWNKKLNEAERIIAENYLSSKYNVALVANDYYAHDAAFPAASHREDVSGIGRVDASNIHDDTYSGNIFRVYNPSDLGDGEFLLFGHNNGSLAFTTSSAPAGYAISERVWRFDMTGDVGNISIAINASQFLGMGDDLFLLIDDDGDFSSGSTIVSLSETSLNNFSANTLTIPDGAYVCIGKTFCAVNPGTASFAADFIYDGETAALQLNGHDPTATVQWQISENNGVYTDIPGALAVPYTTTALDSTNTYTFRAKVSDGCVSFSNEIEISFIKHKYIIISNVETGNQNTGNQTIDVSFNIAWDESWRNATNWDAVWLYGKYRLPGGLWKHITMTIDPTDLTLPAGAAAEIGRDGNAQSWGNRGMGVFLYRDANGSGNINWNDVSFKWNYQADTLSDADVLTAEIMLFGIDMVYVPQGAFHLGSGGSEYSKFYKNANTTSTFEVASNDPILVNSGTNYLNYQLTSGGSGYGDQGDRLGPIPATFPKGFEAFYSMKYPLTQKQYADFLNMLTRAQQNARCALTTVGRYMTDAAAGSTTTFLSYRNGIRLLQDPGSPHPKIYGCDFNGNFVPDEDDDGLFIACNWLSYIDEWAFADWSGLRPITELEYEKMSRGTAAPVPNEMAWGTALDTVMAQGVVNSGWYNESLNPPNANVQIGFHGTGNPPPIYGPVRVGCFGNFGDSRIQRGTTFYGNFDVSGGLWERVVTIGTPAGRAYDGTHGDGTLTDAGLYSINTLEIRCMGYRGGSFRYELGYERTSDRFHGANLCPSGHCYSARYDTFGARLGRTSSGCPPSSSDAGSDTTICGTTLALVGDTAWNYDSIKWTTSGTGTFSDDTDFHPEYYVSADDIAAGSIYLKLTAYSDCGDSADSILVKISGVPTVDAGSSITICSGENAVLNAATINGHDSLLWTSSGTGSFVDAALLNTEYSPSAGDLLADSIMLYLTAYGVCDNSIDSISLKFHEIPAATLAGDTTICEGEQAVFYVYLTGEQPWSFTWSDGTANHNETNITASPHEITFSPSESLSVSIISLSDANCSGTYNGSYDISVTSNIAITGLTETCGISGAGYVVSFEINGGDTASYNISGIGGTLMPGTPYIFTSDTIPSGNSYNINVSDGSGCSSEILSGSFDCSCPASALISGSTTICESDMAQIIVTLTGNSPWTIAISNGSSNDTITGITTSPYTYNASPVNTTTYTLVYFSDAVCEGSMSGSATVTVQPTASAPIATISSPVCQGDTIFMNGVNPPGASWNWYGPAGFQSTLQNPFIPNASATHEGEYTVYVIVNGCNSDSLHLNLTVTNVPVSANPSSNSPVCEGESIMLSAETISGANYSWTGPGGYSSANQNPVISPAQPANAGDYTLTISVDGCSGASETISVEVVAKPVVSISSDTIEVCQNESITLNVGNITGASFTWSGPSGFTSNQQNPQLTNVTAAMEGTYYVYATINACSGDSAQVYLKVLPMPSAPVATYNGPLCEGDTLQLFASTVPGASYQWNGPGGYSSTSQNPIIAAATSAYAGQYTVTAIVSGCSSTVASVNVIVTSAPVTPIISTNSPVCEGGILQLGTSGVSGATYSWTGPNGFSSSLQNPEIQDISSVNAGIYNLSVSVGSCESATATATVVVNPLPAPPIASSNSPVCSGEQIQLSASSVSGATYTWSGPGGFSSSLQNPVINAATTGNSGTYQVYVTQGGCSSDVVSVDVSVIAGPSVNAGGNLSICFNDTAIVTGATASGHISVAWSSSGDGVFSNSTSLQTTYIPGSSDIGTGSVNLTITASSASCGSVSSSMVVSIIQPPILSMPVSASVCQGSAIHVQPATADNYTSVLWTSSGSGSFSNATTIGALYSPSQADANDGYVYLYLTLSSSCGSVIDSTLVTIYPLPYIDAGIDVEIFAGESTSLTASGGISYVWSPDYNLSCTNCQTTTASPLETTVYTVTGTDANGCSAKDEVTVTVNQSDYYFIPKGFSPNGDGQNDVLYVRGAGIKTLHFSVFDRWGQKVFETTDKSIGWDGSFKGKMLDPGVFVWYVVIVFHNNQRIEEQGNVTLVK